MKKIFIGFAVVALLVGVSVTSVQAQSTADLEALIAQLTAQISALGGSTPATGGYAFSANLSKGSRGADVTALQEILISGGYLNIAAPTGYFGDLTKAAVMKWQTAESLTPDGKVGPISRGVLNSMGSVMTPGPIGPGPVGTTCPNGMLLANNCMAAPSGQIYPAGCTSMSGFSPITGLSCATPLSPFPAGCTSTSGFSPTTGMSCAGTVAPVTYPAGCTSAVGFSPTTGMSCAVTTPAPGAGTEGSLTVTVNAIPGSGLTLREGDLKQAVLGLKLEAKLSDITVQRVKVDLNTDTVVYNKLFDRIYVMDGSTVLAESALNSSTVVKDGSTYYITLAGFNFVVPKDTIKVLTLALDAKSTIDSTYDANATYGLLIPADGVRGVDSLGLSQKGPTTALARRTVTIDADALIDSAKLTISYDSSSPATKGLVARENSDGDEYDKLPLLVFGLKGEKDAVKITELIAGITRGVGTVATATTAYLYEGATISADNKVVGGTVVGTATVNSTSATAGTATFANFDYIIPTDTTKTLILAVDIRDADTTGTTFIGSVTAGTDVDVENTSGTAITETGTATGNTFTILDSGLELSLVSTPTISKVVATSDAGVSTTTITAIFNIRAKAVGSSIVLPTNASATPMFAKTGATNSFTVYADSAAATLTAYSTSTDYTIPTTCSTGSLTNGCTLSDGSYVDIPVTYTFVSRNVAGTAAAAGNYAVQLIKVNYGATVTTSTFMSSVNTWRTTPAVYVSS